MNATKFISESDNHTEAWTAFLRNPSALIPGVRPEVLASWRESVSSGVDPYDTQCCVMKDSELENFLAQHADILDVSKWVIDLVKAAMNRSNFLLTLANNKGLILAVHGEGSITEAAEKNHYIVGASRANQSWGTNSISVALSEGKAIQLTGAEHFKEASHKWTCASAPIKDEAGRTLCVLSLSGFVEDTHPHTLATSICAARAIESSLREKQALSQAIILTEFLDCAVDVFTDGLIGTDATGIIRHANDTAARVFDLPRDSITNIPLARVIGKKTAELCLTQELSEFDLPTGKSKLAADMLLTVRHIRTDSHLTGMILTFTRKRRLGRLVQRVGGHNAKYTFNDLLGQSPEWVRQINFAKSVASSDSKVLISGESGTGKEVIAQSIHNASQRRRNIFLAINCAAIPSELMESEFFGYDDGAFTGARKGGQRGKFELADGGTILLDEIDSIPLHMQAKLLRVLQEKKITRLGSGRVVDVDVRIIATSSRQLRSMIDAGEFRLDLYFRLSVVEIHTLSLRERLDDLPMIIEVLLSRINRTIGSSISKVNRETMDLLLHYSWPGNFRELENCLERAVVLYSNDANGVFKPEYLPRRILDHNQSNHNVNNEPRLLHGGAISDIRFASSTMPRPKRKRKPGPEEIIEALKANEFNVTSTADALNISRATMHRWMTKYNISRNQ